MSQLTNNNNPNETAADAPQLCNSCFEFFGFKHTDFLCSKCFKYRYLFLNLSYIIREKCSTDQQTAKILTKPLVEDATHLTA